MSKMERNIVKINEISICLTKGAFICTKSNTERTDAQIYRGEVRTTLPEAVE